MSLYLNYHRNCNYIACKWHLKAIFLIVCAVPFSLRCLINQLTLPAINNGAAPEQLSWVAGHLPPAQTKHPARAPWDALQPQTRTTGLLHGLPRKEKSASILICLLLGLTLELWSTILNFHDMLGLCKAFYNLKDLNIVFFCAFSAMLMDLSRPPDSTW